MRYASLMTYSRRDLTLLLGAAAAGAVRAEAQLAKLPSKTYNLEDLTVRNTGPNGQNKSRSVMHGTTHNGFSIESHITDLAPGLSPHPPHRHIHEELLMLREGTLEVTIAGHTTTAGPGSVTYIGSNDEHSVKNIGSTRAIYFIVELRGDEAPKPGA